jgi:hypothetical protein
MIGRSLGQRLLVIEYLQHSSASDLEMNAAGIIQAFGWAQQADFGALSACRASDHHPP